MSLLDTIEPNPQVRETVHEAAWRRLRYLMGRARWRSEQIDEAPGADRALPDRAGWATASLWMDAIETALFIGDAETARGLLPEAIQTLQRLGHPLGEALQQAFMPARARRIEPREPSPLLEAPGAQVWAQFADRSWFASRERRPGGWDLRTPVGRMGVPVADVLRLARWRDTERDDAGAEQAEGASAVLQRLLDQQYTALAQAQQNTHLWHRLLVPAPLFDLELAVLLAAGLTQRGSAPSPASLAAQRLLREAQAFGSAYLQAVMLLRG